MYLMCPCRIGWWVGLPLALTTSVYEACGLQAATLLVGQALVGILLLETVNYIEHYGLQRRGLAQGGCDWLASCSVFLHDGWMAGWGKIFLSNFKCTF